MSELEYGSPAYMRTAKQDERTRNRAAGVCIAKEAGCTKISEQRADGSFKARCLNCRLIVQQRNTANRRAKKSEATG